MTAAAPATGSIPIADSPGPSETVIVYTKKPCPQCDATLRMLDSRGITPVQIRIDDADGAVILEELKAEGFGSAPVVKILQRGDEGGTSQLDSWAGFDPNKIDQYWPRGGGNGRAA